MALNHQGRHLGLQGSLKATCCGHEFSLDDIRYLPTLAMRLSVSPLQKDTLDPSSLYGSNLRQYDVQLGAQLIPGFKKSAKEQLSSSNNAKWTVALYPPTLQTGHCPQILGTAVSAL
jgi:hypothetical protein